MSHLEEVVALPNVVGGVIPPPSIAISSQIQCPVLSCFFKHQSSSNIPGVNVHVIENAYFYVLWDPEEEGRNRKEGRNLP